VSAQSKHKPDSYVRDLTTLGVIVGIIVLPWAIIWIGAAAAGGHPHLGLLAGWEWLLHQVFSGHPLSLSGMVGATHPVRAVFYLVMSLLVVGLVGITVAVVAYFHGGLPAFGPRMGAAPRSLPKFSRMATPKEIRRMRVRHAEPGRFIVGQWNRWLIAPRRGTSLLVVGPTQSHKTSTVVIPALFEWRGPALVTSTKAELVEITAAFRQQNVGPVWIYDPTQEIGDPYGTSEDGYQTVTFSPLASCMVPGPGGKKVVSWDASLQVASWMAQGLAPSGGQQGGSENDWRHWRESSKRLLAPLFFLAGATGRNIIDVRQWVDGSDLEGPLDELEKIYTEGGPLAQQASIAMDVAGSIADRPDRERQTVFSTVQGIFSVFLETAVADSAMTSSFDADALIKENGTLYLITPDKDKTRVASLFIAITETVVSHAFLMGKLSHKGRIDPELGLFLDELANVVPIEALDDYASQGVGRGVLLMSIVQDLSQLVNKYGEARARTIINNHGALLVLPMLKDQYSMDLLSNLVGQGAFQETSYSYNDGKRGRSVAERQQAMVPAATLRTLVDGTAMLLDRNQPPALLRQRWWKADPHMEALSHLRFLRRVERVVRHEEEPAAVR
jgi:type IV secretory pathway TraG/TraD family ATPase VirD4